MALPASDDFHCDCIELAAADEDEAREKVGGVVQKNVELIQQLESSSIDSKKMVPKECLQTERQISIDPISLKDSASSHKFILSPPIVSDPKLSPPPQPTKFKLLSYSLPNSTTSSPSSLLKKKLKNQSQAPPCPMAIAHQHSVATSRLTQLQENHLQRSKSCGEERARLSSASDEFELWKLTKPSRRHGMEQGSKFSTMDGNRSGEEEGAVGSCDEQFKCGSLCLFLPVFGNKGKPVKPRKTVLANKNVNTEHIAISRTASLENFECGSWTSSAILNECSNKNDSDHGDSSNKYFFDLPLELIRSDVNDASSPVRAAFVFDSDKKGVLKNGTSTSRPSLSSSARHVRFSTPSPSASSASCNAPSIQKAREDFTAFLEAQNA